MNLKTVEPAHAHRRGFSKRAGFKGFSRRGTAVICGLGLLWGTAAAPGFEILINAGPGLAGNAPALAAFQRAAALWSARLADPITVRINADLAPLEPGILGSADSTLIFGDDFAEIRDAMVADALAEGGDAVVAALPTFANLQVTLPAGRTLFNSMVLTQANAKALGFQGVEAVTGHNEDAVITFSTEFSFDFDNRDGVDFFSYDFETAAAHEIGHALGFISSVDDIDATSAKELPQVTLSALDLFRFGSAAGLHPSTLEQFTALPRNLVPGDAAQFDDTLWAWSLSTGVNGGDGRQASHWKDDLKAGDFIGLMDPTLSNGEIEMPTQADFRALDVLGYQLMSDVVPEPGGVALLLLGALPVLARRWNQPRKPGN